LLLPATQKRRLRGLRAQVCTNINTSVFSGSTCLIGAYESVLPKVPREHNLKYVFVVEQTRVGSVCVRTLEHDYNQSSQCRQQPGKKPRLQLRHDSLITPCQVTGPGSLTRAYFSNTRLHLHAVHHGFPFRAEAVSMQGWCKKISKLTAHIYIEGAGRHLKVEISLLRTNHTTAVCNSNAKQTIVLQRKILLEKLAWV
jgi:hypothetical protein